MICGPTRGNCLTRGCGSSGRTVQTPVIHTHIHTKKKMKTLRGNSLNSVFGLKLQHWFLLGSPGSLQVGTCWVPHSGSVNQFLIIDQSINSFSFSLSLLFIYLYEDIYKTIHILSVLFPRTMANVSSDSKNILLKKFKKQGATGSLLQS
jgi:hypothetical protein